MNNKNKHLDLQQRLTIEQGLNDKLSFKLISSSINKNCSTISKEIRLNSIITNSGAYGHAFNNCFHRDNCEHISLCSLCQYKSKHRCRSCNLCRFHCPDFLEETCPHLSKPPYVCNGCSDKRSCTLSKRIYNAHEAQNAYLKRYNESRCGFVLSLEEIERLNNILVPLICEQHQSIHHAYINNIDRIMYSERTLYRIIDAVLLKIRNIDLPNKVKLRFRRSKPYYKVDKACLEGRRYEDFIAFTTQHPDLPIVQMDSVEGNKGGKVLLTLHFTVPSVMLAYLRDHNDSQSVIDVFDQLYVLLGRELFMKLFPVILTDNGSEFSNPKAIEFDSEGHRRTYIFYCHPSAPYEKGACEVNHQLLRRILPKGSSFDFLSQEKVDLMMSHINSYHRAKLNDKSPFSVFSDLYGEETLTSLNLSKIDANDITLSPSLVKNEVHIEQLKKG